MARANTATPCLRLPELELIRSKPISSDAAVAKLQEFVETGLTVPKAEEKTQMTAGKAEIISKDIRTVAETLQRDWKGHSESKLFSCFVEVHARIEVHLHPMFLGENLKRGLRKAAFEILGKWQHILDCMPLTLDGLEPEGSRHGSVVSDSPYVHFLASFKCLGFKPERNHYVLGRVAEGQLGSSKYGLNITAFDLVNIWVPAKSLPEEIKYRRVEEEGDKKGQLAWLNEKGRPLMADKHVVLLCIAKREVISGGSDLSLHGRVDSVEHIRIKRKPPKLDGGSMAIPISPAASGRTQVGDGSSGPKAEKRKAGELNGTTAHAVEETPSTKKKKKARDSPKEVYC